MKHEGMKHEGFYYIEPMSNYGRFVCSCGHRGFYDGDDYVFYECESCGRKYAIEITIILLKDREKI